MLNKLKNILSSKVAIITLLTLGSALALFFFLRNDLTDADDVLTLNDFMYVLENEDVVLLAFQHHPTRNSVRLEGAYQIPNEIYGTDEATDSTPEYWINHIVIIVNETFIDTVTEIALEREIPVVVHGWDDPFEFPWAFAGTLLLVGVMLFMINKQTSFLSVKKSTPVMSKIKFKDVAGQNEEKAELVELVDILKSPEKYAKLGAKVPTGVLLEGPPGTGKTLLAKAVAGEAGVPFYATSGSEFDEMLVGMGASRIRSLFEEARENAPCIVFIDEIDVLGKKRNSPQGGGESSQTLNQLLTELDGFKSDSGVIIMGATNLAEVLDPALLRPGRFDRKITVGLPDVKDRVDILKVHSKNKTLDESVELEHIAKRTPGMSGAELEGILNEAVLLATRDSRKAITMQDIDEASDKILMGPAKIGKVISEKERNTIAYHEAGHVVAGMILNSVNKVHKVTIVPRGRAGGYALMLPEEETMLSSKREMLDSIVVYLAGRAAEELMFGEDEITSGASADLQSVAKIANRMIVDFGMGGLNLIQPEARSVNYNPPADLMKDINEAINKIINEGYENALSLVKENKELLTVYANELLEKETLTKEQIEIIFNENKNQ